MQITGFTFVRNAERLYYPVKESILSILPLVDKFIVALGNSDDNTEALIRSINSEKIEIFHRTWDERAFVEGKIFADETNFALRQCTGDWCFYLQADEVVHENDLDTIYRYCYKNLENFTVEGFLLNYYHFWGDYEHYLPFHGWYKREIRIVRNSPDIVSYKDAQSFRKTNHEKLRVRQIPAYVYHYGWVRPPHLMQIKKKEQDSMYHGCEEADRMHLGRSVLFNYGNMKKIPVFKGTHPHVMKDFIRKFHWGERLQNSNQTLLRPKMKHEKIKYRILSWFENTFLGGRELFGYRNWKEV
ncbi:MAG: glycosyltransferase family 2 protein [Chitinophagales bacterium]|nr:glycosyltransferase family 2 protein [Chitinophagales bacterium]MDW8273290.1 glycosyltransferase family 2 protein [Chitinophagales bacterium]